MSVSLCPTLGCFYQALGNGGLPLNVGWVYTYIAGGTTPQATYTTSAGNVQNANPIVLNTAGRPPSEVWLTDGVAYRFDQYDALGNLIKTYDNIYGIQRAGGAAYIPFTYSGAGAKETNLQTIVRQWVSAIGFTGVDNTGLSDSYAGVQAAVDSGATAIYFDQGTYVFSLPVQIPAGIALRGAGAGVGTGLKTTITNSVVGGGIFWQTPTTAGGVTQDGPEITGFNLSADFPIMLNNPTVTLADSGAGLNPYIMKPYIHNNYLEARSVGVGRGITLSKNFDFIIERNVINNFDICILEMGSDIGFVYANRIQGFASVGILEISSGNFGSQTMHLQNDILSGRTNSAYFRSCGRHVRFHSNYLESGGSVGAIDAGGYGFPTYGANTPSTPYEIDIQNNRIDGQGHLTGYLYRLDGLNPTTNTIVHDVGTTGTAFSPQLTVVGDNLPVVYSTTSRCAYDIRLPMPGLPNYSDFRTGQQPFLFKGLQVDSRSFSNMENLTSGGFGDDTGYSGAEAIVMSTTLTGNLLASLPAYGAASHPLEQGATYDIWITARSPNNESMVAGPLTNTTGGASTTTALAHYYKTFLVGNFTAPALGNQWGVYLARNGTYTGYIYIQSITWVKN